MRWLNETCRNVDTAINQRTRQGPRPVSIHGKGKSAVFRTAVSAVRGYSTVPCSANYYSEERSGVTSICHAKGST